MASSKRAKRKRRRERAKREARPQGDSRFVNAFAGWQQELTRAAYGVATLSASFERFNAEIEKAKTQLFRFRIPQLPPNFPPFTDAASYLVAADYWDDHGEAERAVACRRWAGMVTAATGSVMGK